jgi:hypothetical protein
MLGASSTAADYTDTRLYYEFNNNTNRISPTNISDVTPLTRSDISLDPVVVSGVTYRKLITFKYALSSTNNLDGKVFQEAGLNTEQATPGSPSTVHGVMLNRVILSPSLTKTAGIPTSVYMQIRF